MKERMTFKILSYDVDYSERFGKDYPRIEPGSLFYMWSDPWNNIHNILRKMIIIHNLYRFISCNKPIRLLDCGAGFGENKIYLNRYRKPKGMKINYQAIDSDPDKRNIAKMIDPNIEYTVNNFEDFFPDSTFDVLICNDIFKFIPQGKECGIIAKIFNLLKPNGILSLSMRTSYLSNNGSMAEEDIVYERTSTELLKSFEPYSYTVLDSFHMGLFEKDLETKSNRVPSRISCYPNSLLQESDNGIRFQLYLQKLGD